MNIKNIHSSDDVLDIGICVKEFSELPQHPKFKLEWTKICNENPECTVFHTMSWVLACLENNQVGKKLIYVFRNNRSELVGVAAFIIRNGRRNFRKLTWLEFATMPHSDYGGIVAKVGYETCIGEELASIILDKNKNMWDAIHFSHVSKTDEVFNTLLNKLTENKDVRSYISKSEYIPILGKILNSNNYSVASMSGRGLKKSKRKLATHGKIVLEIYSTQEEIMDKIYKYIDMHKESFSFRGKTSPLNNDAYNRLFLDVVYRLSGDGTCLLSILSVGDNEVAMRVSFVHNNVVHLYGATFNPEYAKYSPGVIQLVMFTEYLYKQGTEVLNYGYGTSHHKIQLKGEKIGDIYSIDIFLDFISYIDERIATLMRKLVLKYGFFSFLKHLARKVIPYGTS